MTDSDGLIRPGRPAPDLTLPATPDGRRTGPGQFPGRPVVPAFHPADWTPVRADRMALCQAASAEFDRYGAYAPQGQADRDQVVTG